MPGLGQDLEQFELARERTAEARRRTHLANERTFAAWIRTALAVVALGVGIAGYFHLAHEGGRLLVLVGMAFVAAGGLMGAFAIREYREVTREIESGRYRPGSPAMIFLGAIPIVLGLLAVLAIVLLRR